MANAVLVAKLLNKRDPFDTKFGARMKAVTTVDQFLSNFSNNIYTEMEQQLVIAPMFNRIAVDAKTFRVPVADEDTDGDVAQFASGTFATGIADATRVPTSNQNTIASVDFTTQFMATTHLAKDEEEDTVLPLLDFLRSAATRRLARALDKVSFAVLVLLLALQHHQPTLSQLVLVMLLSSKVLLTLQVT